MATGASMVSATNHSSFSPIEIESVKSTATVITQIRKRREATPSARITSPVEAATSVSEALPSTGRAGRRTRR